MILITVRETGPTPGMMRREFNRHVAEAHAHMGAHWHRVMRPEHFTHRGAAKYGYTQRTGKHQRRKLRRFGHTYPLVFTGESRRLSGIMDIRATSRGVRVVMRTRALNFRPKGWTGTMADELRKVTPAEQSELGRVFINTLEARLASITASRTERVA